MDVDYEIDVDELNRRWAHPGNVDEWTQFILKQTDEAVELITEAPASGIWRAGDEGQIAFDRRDTDWHTIADGSEAFYLRIATAGGYRYPGADLGILVTRGRFLDDDHELVDRAREWITGIKGQFRSVPATRARGSSGPTGTLRIQDALMEMVPFTFRSLEELELGPVWAEVFEARWPHYREWFLRDGEQARPSYATSVRMLRAHMPELMPDV